jgi:hypothetical protein
MPSRAGNYQGAAGGAVTAVAFTGTPSAGTPSSLADGATVDAGVLSGLKIHDPHGALNSAIDGGTTQDIAFDRGSGNAANATLNLGNAWLNQPRFYYPELMMGDFEITLYVDQSANAASTATEIGLIAGGGNTSNEAHHINHRFGDYLTSTAAYKTGYAAGTGSYELNGSTAISRSAAPRWIRLQRIGAVVRFSEGGVAATPSWSDTDEQWDAGGGAVYVGFSLHAGSATEETYRIYKITITGSEYTATP